MIYFELFKSFFIVGLFSIGGGYAAMPLIREQVVEINNWISAEVLLDMIAISQTTPGPIAINAATFVGLRVGGFFGAIIATLGCITPSCIIVLTLAYLFFKYKDIKIVRNILSGLRPATVALIASAGVSIFSMAVFKETRIDIIAIIVAALSFAALKFFKANPIASIACSGVLYMGLSLCFGG